MTGSCRIIPIVNSLSVNGHFSDSLSISCGVPKGSVLGPLLLLLYILMTYLTFLKI